MPNENNPFYRVNRCPCCKKRQGLLGLRQVVADGGQGMNIPWWKPVRYAFVCRYCDSRLKHAFSPVFWLAAFVLIVPSFVALFFFQPWLLSTGLFNSQAQIDDFGVFYTVALVMSSYFLPDWLSEYRIASSADPALKA